MSASISLGFPPSAVFLLRPSNSAAQLAFSDVVNFAAEKQQQPDHGPDWVPTFTKFMWLASKDQVASREVGHLIRRRFVAAMPGSSSPAPGTDDDQHSASIWSGGYFITLDAETPTSQWSLGRRSSSYLPDLVLTLDKITHLSRIQAWLRVDAETRRAYLTSRERGRFSINSISPSETPGEVNRLSFNSRSNTFAVGELQYSFDYTDFIATPEGQRTLANYLTKIYGTGSQPPPEAIAATPTPGPTTKTIGAYTLYGILGTGTFGSVRPATSARGDKVLAIKTIVSRSTSSGVIQLMQNLTRLLNSTEWAKRVNILRLVEAFTIPGNLEEIHLVLEPFTPITLEKLPVHTQ